MNIFSNINTLFLWIISLFVIFILIRLVSTFINYKILKSTASALDTYSYYTTDRYHRPFGSVIKYVTFDEFKSIFPLNNKIIISADNNGECIDTLSKTAYYNQCICINDVFYVPETFLDYLNIIEYIDILFVKIILKKNRLPETIKETIMNDTETTIKRIVKIFKSEINDIFILEYIPKKYGISDPFIYYDTDNNDLYLYNVSDDLLTLLVILTITKVSKNVCKEDLLFRTSNELFNMVTTDNDISSYIIDSPGFFMSDGINKLIDIFTTDAPISQDFQTFLRENHDLDMIRNLWKSLIYNIENNYDIENNK